LRALQITWVTWGVLDWTGFREPLLGGLFEEEDVEAFYDLQPELLNEVIKKWDEYSKKSHQGYLVQSAHASALSMWFHTPLSAQR